MTEAEAERPSSDVFPLGNGSLGGGGHKLATPMDTPLPVGLGVDDHPYGDLPFIFSCVFLESGMQANFDAVLTEGVERFNDL